MKMSFCKHDLEIYGMNSAKMAPIPIVENIYDLFMEGSTNEAGQICTTKVPYRELMGSLFYQKSA